MGDGLPQRRGTPRPCPTAAGRRRHRYRGRGRGRRAVAMQPLRRVPLLHPRSRTTQRGLAQPRHATGLGAARLPAREHGSVQMVVQVEPADRLRDAARLPGTAREIDMRASPYDLSDYGYTPIAVEHAAGRAEYVRCQKAVATRAEPLRAALLARCDLLLQSAGCR